MMWRSGGGPVNLQRALMIWGSRLWGYGVDLYTTPTLIAPCGIEISFHFGLATARRISTDPGPRFNAYQDTCCTLLPAALESELFDAWMLGSSGDSDGQLCPTQSQACMRETFRGVWVGGQVHSDNCWASLGFRHSIARDAHWSHVVLVRCWPQPLLLPPIQ